MKVLNLYAGIGGNRKLWTDVEVTAVENNESIATIYQDFFPDDKVIIADAHQYLLEHFKEFDFIWSSPPCPTHSRFNNLNLSQGKQIKYPEMELYQEIILLKYYFKGSWLVENVISFYEPLIKPIESGSHYYWSNFVFTKLRNEVRHIRGNEKNHQTLINKFNVDISKYNIPKTLQIKIINNMVNPEHGLHILECARGNYNHTNQKQGNIF